MNTFTRVTLSTLLLLTSFTTLQAQFPRWNYVGTGHSGIFYNIQRAGAADANGGMYVTGYFSGSMTLPNDTSNGSISGNGQDMFIIKVDSNGNFDWAVDEGGFSDENRSNTIATDDDNRVYYGGYFEGQGTFGGTVLNSSGSSDGIVLARNEDGSYHWRKQLTSSNWANVTRIKSNHNGKIIVQGQYDGSVNLVGSNLTDTSVNSYSFFLAAYRGNNGNLLWGFNLNNSPLTGIETMGTDYEGNTYLCFDGIPESTDWTIGSIALSPADNQSAAIVKVDEDGNIEWAKRGYARHIIPGRDGHVFLVGEAEGTHTYDGTNIPVGNELDAFILKINGDGDLMEHQVLAGNEDHGARSASADDSGFVYMHGFLGATMQVDGQNINSTKTADHYLVRFDQDLNVQDLHSIGAQNISVRYVDVKRYPLVNIVGGYGSDQNIGGFPVVDNGNSAYFFAQYQLDSILTAPPVDTTDTTPESIAPILNASEISFFPNPADDRITIQNGSNSPIVQAEVLDLTGRQVISDNSRIAASSRMVLDLSSMRSGTYILRLNNGQGTISKSLVKK